MYQLTNEMTEIEAGRLTRKINNDYPDVAIVKNKCVFITNEYWQWCKDFVQANCKLQSDTFDKRLKIINNKGAQ